MKNNAAAMKSPSKDTAAGKEKAPKESKVPEMKGPLSEKDEVKQAEKRLQKKDPAAADGQDENM